MRQSIGMFLCGLLLAGASSATAAVEFGIDASHRGPEIGKLHYGIFFEEINHAGDGGIYAELVRNRSFEDNTGNPDGWSKTSGVTWKLVTDNLLNSAQGQALDVTFGAAGDAVTNEGFWGMNCEAGKSYRFSFWVRSDKGYDSNLTAEMVSHDGKPLGNATVAVKAGKDWTKYTATIQPSGSDTNASLKISAGKAGNLTLDMVSLFPPTFKDRENGCRPDLAQMLADMHPAFMRFPGGCYIEGTHQNGVTNRFEWKKTIGPVETRPGHRNVNWNYRVSDGLGFHEMLQLSEDLGAEPLFVVNIGLGHGWSVPYNSIDEYIQEALDALEYCNGDVTTEWGAVRAANGHPEPFNLRLIEVGNENYQADANQQSDHYAERYIQFYNAIKAAYPEAIVIGNVESWGTDTPSWRNEHPVDAVDEHYYRNPSWFAANYNKYDSYSRQGPKVYAGEYAVTSDFGTNGTLRAALGEAIYMLGMENNSDVCIMNSYAPIFVNENDQCWRPDMIRFNSSESYGTPSYYVQKLFANNVGSRNLKWTETGNTQNAGNKVGFSTWKSTAEFDNVRVSDTNGNPVWSEDFTTAPAGWTMPSGWSVTDGVLRMTDGSAEGLIAASAKDAPDNFIFEFDAKKTGGDEGFLVAFNYGGPGDYIWWNLGGWSNTRHAVEISRNGSKSSYGSTNGTIETNHLYHGRIVLSGTSLRCYLDNVLIHDIEIPADRKIYMSANLSDDEKTLYVKTVNMNADDVPVTLNLANGKFVSGEATVMANTDSEAENSVDNQNNVVPVPGSVTVTAGKADFTAPANSMCILKFTVSDVVSMKGKPMSEAALAEINASLGGLRQRLANLRAGAQLPVQLDNAATIEWSLSADADPNATLSTSAWTTTLDVTAVDNRDAKRAAGTLTANVTAADGSTGTLSFPVTVAPLDDAYGYLYCYMNSGKEITNYALGTKEDNGRVFNQLNDGKEIFDTEALCGIEHGSRDAYMQKGQRDHEWFMTVTDMCNAKSKVWNNYGIDLLRSNDLIHWESTVFDFRQGKKIFSDPDAVTDLYKTDEEYAKIRRVWAPQFIWDPAAFNGQGGYLVYYSVLSDNAGDNHDRIVYSYADKDFKTLTQPRIFHDPGYSVIDCDIVYNDYDGKYHLWIKHEGASGTERGIWHLTSDRLVGDDWTYVDHNGNEGSENVEGSSAIRRINEDDMNIYYMRYSGGSHYKVCTADHLGTNVKPSSDLGGNGAFQHGSVLYVNEAEYTLLTDWNELLKQMEWAQATESPIFKDALAQADAALKVQGFDALSEAIAKALDAMMKAREAYMKDIVDNARDGDITSLIVNPDFNGNNGRGWSGTWFTATNKGVAEFYNTTFDAYQELPYMPAGEYTLTCSGFYRNGGKEAYSLHTAGTEALLAEVYMNETGTPFMSLFSADKYTNSPYTFPDDVTTANNAFNTDGSYAGNTVKLTLDKTSTLRLGVRKSVHCDRDWTCFDNFRLTYTPDHSGMTGIVPDSNASVNVYSLEGMLLRRDVRRADATAGLAPGLYIVGRTKVAVR